MRLPTPRTLIAAACGLAGLLLLTGCTHADENAALATPPAVVREALLAAQKGGASDAQVELLSSAATEGRDVTYEEYLSAARRTLDCVNKSPLVMDAGLTEYSQDGGKAVSVWLSTANGDNAADGAYDDCYLAELNYVESAYQQRAEVQDWRAAVDKKYIDSIRECIESRGIATESGWTVADMLQAEADQFPNGDVDARCAAITGYEQEMTG